MTDLGLSTNCRLAKPGVFDGKVSGNCPDAVWRISYSFMTAGEDGSGRRMMGGQEMEGMADWGDCVAGEKERNRKILV